MMGAAERGIDEIEEGEKISPEFVCRFELCVWVLLHASASTSPIILSTHLGMSKCWTETSCVYSQVQGVSAWKGDNKKENDKRAEYVKGEEGVTQLGQLLPKFQIRSVTGGRV